MQLRHCFLMFLSITFGGCATTGAGPEESASVCDYGLAQAVNLVVPVCSIKKGFEQMSRSRTARENYRNAEKNLRRAEENLRRRRAGPYVQSADPKCPGWAIASIALNDYPIAKAVRIISDGTVGAKPRYYSADEISPELLRVGDLIRAKCSIPAPGRDYTKLEWSCAGEDPECPQKTAFAKKYEAVLRMTDQDQGVAALKNLLGQSSYAEEDVQ